jgi:hypothetical protein
MAFFPIFALRQSKNSPQGKFIFTFLVCLSTLLLNHSVEAVA